MSIMKKIIIFILILGCIYGCTPTPQHKEESFSLNKNRIQVKLNDDIDYLSYVEANDDLKNEIKYNEIDTSKTGTYEIQYTNQKQKQTLIVDVVQMYENSIFNPLDINPEVIKNPEDITSLVNKVYQIPEKKLLMHMHNFIMLLKKKEFSALLYQVIAKKKHRNFTGQDKLTFVVLNMLLYIVPTQIEANTN